MALRAVLFDLDCTLTDRRASLAKAAEMFVNHFPGCLTGTTFEAFVDCLVRADRWGYCAREEFVDQVLREMTWKIRPPAQEFLDSGASALPDAP